MKNEQDLYESEILDNEDDGEYDEFQYYLNDILSSNIDIGIDESQRDDGLNSLTFELEV